VGEYMRRIEAKTALLVAACCDIGGLLGGLDGERRAALRGYGRELGLAFQIADDVLDYLSSEGEVGKPIGHDIAEGFATLPLMLAREDASINQKLAALLGEGTKLGIDQAQEIVELVRNSNGTQRALEQAREHERKARENLRSVGAGEATGALGALAGYVVTRKL